MPRRATFLDQVRRHLRRRLKRETLRAVAEATRVPGVQGTGYLTAN